MGGLVLALVGMILIVALPLDNNSGRLAGYYLTQASPTPFVALLSLISTNVAGYTKKTTGRSTPDPSNVYQNDLHEYSRCRILNRILHWKYHRYSNTHTNSRVQSADPHLIGPQTFRPKDAPRYKPAEITIIVCWGVCLIDLYFIWWYCQRQNKKKALVRAEPGYVKLENQE